MTLGSLCIIPEVFPGNQKASPMKTLVQDRTDRLVKPVRVAPYLLLPNGKHPYG